MSPNKTKSGYIILSIALLSVLTLSSCTSLAFYTGGKLANNILSPDTNFSFSYNEKSLIHATPHYDSEFMKAASQHGLVQNLSINQQDQLKSMVRALMMGRNITPLELILNDERKTLRTLPDGTYALHYIHQTLGDELLIMGKRDDSKVESFLQEWAQKYPQSIYPTLLLSRFYQVKGMDIRGGDYALETPAEQLDKCEEYARKSAETLTKVSQFKGDDPYIYMTGLTATKYGDFSTEALQNIFMQGVDKYPDFLPLYLRFSNSLVLRWYGSTDDLKAYSYWAMSNPKAHQDPFIRYASIPENVISYPMSTEEFVGYQFNWPDIQEGLIRLTRNHQLSSDRLKRFCWMAVAYKDKKTAKMLYTLLGPDFDKQSNGDKWWGTEDLVNARDWAISEK